MRSAAGCAARACSYIVHANFQLDADRPGVRRLVNTDHILLQLIMMNLALGRLAGVLSTVPWGERRTIPNQAFFLSSHVPNINI